MPTSHAADTPQDASALQMTTLATLLTFDFIGIFVFVLMDAAHSVFCSGTAAIAHKSADIHTELAIEADYYNLPGK